MYTSLESALLTLTIGSTSLIYKEADSSSPRAAWTIKRPVTSNCSNPWSCVALRIVYKSFFFLHYY